MKIKQTTVLIAQSKSGTIVKKVQINSKHKPERIANTIANEMLDTNWIDELNLQACNECFEFFDVGQLAESCLCALCKMKLEI